MDCVLRSIHADASLAKRRAVIDPCCGSKEDCRDDNDRYGQQPQSPGDPPSGCSHTTHNVHRMPVDGERRNIKPKSSYWVAARPGQKVVASDSVREFYSSSAYRGPQGRVKLAPSFGRLETLLAICTHSAKGRHHPMQTLGSLGPRSAAAHEDQFAPL